jgi:hypothetical protein
VIRDLFRVGLSRFGASGCGHVGFCPRARCGCGGRNLLPAGGCALDARLRLSLLYH